MQQGWIILKPPRAHNQVSDIVTYSCCTLLAFGGSACISQKYLIPLSPCLAYTHAKPKLAIWCKGMSHNQRIISILYAERTISFWGFCLIWKNHSKNMQNQHCQMKPWLSFLQVFLCFCSGVVLFSCAFGKRSGFPRVYGKLSAVLRLGIALPEGNMVQSSECRAWNVICARQPAHYVEKRAWKQEPKAERFFVIQDYDSGSY